MHFETSPHPLVGDVWSHGGVLEESTEHAKLWVQVGESPAVKPVLVVDLGRLSKHFSGKRVEFVFWGQANDIFGQFGV